MPPSPNALDEGESKFANLTAAHSFESKDNKKPTESIGVASNDDDEVDESVSSNSKEGS